MSKEKADEATLPASQEIVLERVTGSKGGIARSSRGRLYGTTDAPGCDNEPVLWEEEVGAWTMKRPGLARHPSLCWRALGSAGVLALFALGVSIASARLTTERGRLKVDHGATGTVTMWDETPLIRDTDGSPTLAITATNEYGEYDRAALALYGLEMVVEPYRETTLAAEASASTEQFFHWRVDQADASGAPLETVGPVLDVVGGDVVTVTFRMPGVYVLVVEQQRPDGTLISDRRVTVSCKYVRRELRDLTATDLEEFLDAMQAYYTLPTEEGQTKYGENFFNYERITAYHNAKLSRFCYHAGIQFLTAHAAFGLMVERSLQAVNPRVSMPFWDYMIDASTLGTEWAGSEIFGDDMFGRAMGSAENGHQVTEGRFGNIATIYDPDDSLVDSRICTNHNAYGYVSAVYNYQDLPLLSRASSFCNLKAHSTFAKADDFFACFANRETLADWEGCMEKRVHGDMHGLLGGAFNCNVDMQQFHEEHPEYSAGLLTFVVGFLTSNKWPGNTLVPGYNDCDTECVSGQMGPCGCTCKLDAFALSEDEVYSLLSDFLEGAGKRFAADIYVSYDASSDRPIGLKQDGVRLGDDATMLLLRHLVKIGCEPGAVGSMCGGSSPMDPLFWMLHPMFEKALHVLWLSPKYRDSYSFEWEPGTCNGSKQDDELPFTEKALGMGTGRDFLTNSELMRLLYPSPSSPLTYVYEKFSSWGTTNDWDFCPECTAAASATAGGRAV